MIRLNHALSGYQDVLNQIDSICLLEGRCSVEIECNLTRRGRTNNPFERSMFLVQSACHHLTRKCFGERLSVQLYCSFIHPTFPTLSYFVIILPHINLFIIVACCPHCGMFKGSGFLGVYLENAALYSSIL